MMGIILICLCKSSNLAIVEEIYVVSHALKHKKVFRIRLCTQIKFQLACELGVTGV